MGSRFEATASTIIAVPIAAVFETAADIVRTSAWRPETTEIRCLNHGSDGRQDLVEVITLSQGRRIRSVLRYEYAPPHAILWRQIEGDMPDAEGSWSFSEAATGTRAEYRLSLDLGLLGRVIRGPVADRLRRRVVDDMPPALKREAESRA